MFSKETYSWFDRHKTLLGVLCLFVLSISTISKAFGQGEGAENDKVNKIYLLRANTLEFDKERNAD